MRDYQFKTGLWPFFKRKKKKKSWQNFNTATLASIS